MLSLRSSRRQDNPGMSGLQDPSFRRFSLYTFRMFVCHPAAHPNQSSPLKENLTIRRIVMESREIL